MTLKIAVLAPIPSASVRTAMVVNDGARRKRRTMRLSLPGMTRMDHLFEGTTSGLGVYTAGGAR